MKFRFGSFLSGFLAAGVLFSVSALAISGRMTIEVDPINVQINGEVFQPTDVNGKEVPVFAYQGTTYAPLRALAEAYGLEVGYDKAANMATVSDPEAKPEQPAAPDTTAKADYDHWSAEDEAAYQEFKGLWEDAEVDGLVMTVKFNGPENISELIAKLKKIDEQMLIKYASRMRDTLKIQNDLFRFCFEERILFAIHTGGTISYASAWSAGH